MKFLINILKIQVLRESGNEIFNNKADISNRNIGFIVITGSNIDKKDYPSKCSEIVNVLDINFSIAVASLISLL